MRLYPRTALTMLAVAGVPLALSGWGSTTLSEKALRARAAELHGAVADGLAHRLNDALVGRIRSVQQAAGTVRFASLSNAALAGAQRLIYRQVDGASAVVVFDRKDRQAGVTEFLHEAIPDDATLADRPVLTDADIGELGRHLPIAAARQVGAATSAPYVGSDGAPRLTVAARTDDDWVLAVELSLGDLQAIVAEQAVGDGGIAYVVDADGAVIFARGTEAVLAREDRSKWPAVAATIAGRALSGELVAPNGEVVLGASASIDDLRWWVIVEEPVESALAAARELTLRTLLTLVGAVSIATLLGLFFARALLRPIRGLHDGAAKVSSGDLGHRVIGADRADELGDLARVFNHMAQEIQRWNAELEARVRERTQELEQAQDLLLRSQKLAAVGELGAGVAHEINNPLTGLLGMVQLLQFRTADPDLNKGLSEIEEQAQRILEIVRNLQNLTSERQTAATQAIRVEEALEGALSLMAGQLQEQGIEVVRRYQNGLPDIPGDPVKLSEAFFHLISNARKAMANGGRLTLGISSQDGQYVAVRLADTGIGIPKALHSRIFEPFFSGRAEWRSKGLGLSFVNQIVSQHQGRVVVDSDEGRGATFTVLLPAVQTRSLA